MLSMTCRNCDETMAAETEDELLALRMKHAAKHGHTPRSEHVLKRIGKQNTG